MDQDSSLRDNEEPFHIFPLYIEPWGPEGQMGHASGFVVKKTVFEETAMGTSQGLTKHLQQIDNFFLITTWQVVTGINLGVSTEHPKTLDEVRVAVLCGKNEGHERTCHRIPLYSENMTPNWIEHPKGGQEVDVVALPITLPTEAILAAHHNTSCTKPQLEAKVSVLGYPLDINTAGKMKMALSPMWMEAAIVNIPEDESDHLFHINPQAGSGMAGAPVWFLDKSESSAKHISPRCVAGVYSGNSIKEATEGIVWGIDVVWELLDNPRQGFNPTTQIPQIIEKHNINGSDLVNDEIFIHFTANRNALLSILNFGLLYLHNETEIFIDLIGDYLNIDTEPETSGMVCFTDLPIDELKALRDTGNTLGSKLTGYGIAGSSTLMYGKV